MVRYNNYHKHDGISSIFGMPDSATSQEEYIKRCVELGHTNYFTTNHGSFGDIFEAKTLCDKYGLRCIAGIEGYIVPNPYEKDNSNYHIIIIPKTDVARKKMNVISSRANIEGFYYKPRIFIEDLLALDSNDIFITTACEGGLLKDEISYAKLFFPLMKKFGGNMMLEVQNHNTQTQKAINERCLDLRKEYGLHIICANDSHYIDEKGKRQRAELLRGKKISYGDEDTYTLDFPDTETMFYRFKKQGVLSEDQIEQGIKNTLLFDCCEEIGIDKEIKMPNIYKKLTPKERVSLLKDKVKKNFSTIIKKENLTREQIDERVKGLNEEMKVIEDTNEEIHTADYFLFNERNTDLAVNKYGGVLTRGGRGSCGSYYTNKILGITQIDRFTAPIPVYPDRFMSTARLLENRAIPDIDFNVSSQEPFVKATRELLGEHGCYPMIAYGTMGESESFRNTCRAKGLDFDEYNEVGKDLERYKDDEKWKPIIEEAMESVGVIVSASVHPCAFCLSDKNILEEYGVVRIGGNICVMVTSSEADEYKILKND